MSGIIELKERMEISTIPLCRTSAQISIREIASEKVGKEIKEKKRKMNDREPNDWKLIYES